jgi:hypothetical protein
MYAPHPWSWILPRKRRNAGGGDQFLATSGEAMFMKPTVSQRLAESVGLALNYKPEPNWLTYSKLVETASNIRARLSYSGQEARSGIDVQSFMWCAYEQSKR